MENVRENTETWDSPVVRMLRWVVLLPVGLGVLWIVEFVFNLLVDWVLDWNVGGFLYYVVFVGGGFVLLLAMIFVGRLTSQIIAAIAPRFSTGILLLGIVYVIAQLVWLYILFDATRTSWPYIITKVEMTVVVAYMFMVAYRDTDG